MSVHYSPRTGSRVYRELAITTRAYLNEHYSVIVDGMRVGQTIGIQIERSYARRTFASWIRAHRLSVASREKDICIGVCTFVLRKIK